MLAFMMPSCRLRQCTRELPLEPAVDPRAHGFERHSAQHVSRKRMDQQPPRRSLAEPARAQVKERLLVELPHRRAMRALDVVREDLELRLGIDARILGEKE